MGHAGLASEYIKAAEGIASASPALRRRSLRCCLAQPASRRERDRLRANVHRKLGAEGVPPATRRRRGRRARGAFQRGQGDCRRRPGIDGQARFASGIAAIIEAVLVAPDFLYKPEFGVADAANPALKRPDGI